MSQDIKCSTCENSWPESYGKVCPRCARRMEGTQQQDNVINTTNLRLETVDPTPRGGQHCGVIPRGVKATHVPTGLSAYCGSERSQMRNRDIAISMLEWGMVELGVSDAPIT